MNTIEKLLETRVLIRFSDCDPFNHLNNSKYIDYFLNAREDQLIEYYNFYIYEHSKLTGCAWVVGQNQIVYIKPAITMETVIIQSQVINWGEKDILVEFMMWDENRKKLKSVMWSKFYYFNIAEQRSAIHTEELNTKFKQVEIKAEGMESFEKRIEILRQIK